jgi:hypothetical protein
MNPVTPQTPQFLNAQNPWNGTVVLPLAYNNVFTALVDTLPATVRAKSTVASLGQVQTSFLPPAPATGAAGVVAVSVWLNNTFNETGVAQHVFYKLGNVD